MDEKTALAYAITKALAYTENGGKPGAPRAGKTGELKSIFQFTPATWRKDAQDVLGDPSAPLTSENESKVAFSKVHQWVSEGKTARQIASMWNAGVGEPDAWTGKFSNGAPSKSVNKQYGVPFDVPAYANKVQSYAKDFYAKDFASKVNQQETPSVGMSDTPAAPVTPAPQTQTPSAPQSNGGTMGRLLESLAGVRA